jgi:hypothetical protein
MEVEGRVEFHSHYQQRSDVPASCTHRLRQISRYKQIKDWIYNSQSTE